MMWKQLFKRAPKDNDTTEALYRDTSEWNYSAPRTSRGEAAAASYTPTSAQALISAARSVS